MLRNTLLPLLLALMVSVASACGTAATNDNTSTKEKPAAKEVTQEQVTLRIYQKNASLTDDEFQKFLADPVKKKYPNITLELVRAQKESIQDALAAGDFPDLIWTGGGPIKDFIDLQAVTELSGLVKQFNLDLGAFYPQVIDGIKNFADNGQLYALPFSINFAALYYNKDIFDKFGVPYPPEKVTWDQAIDISKKVARTDGGTTYKPLYPGSFTRFIAPLAQPLVDQKTNKAHLLTDSIGKALNLYKSIADLPGNQIPNQKGSRDAFMKDQSLAMLGDTGAVIGQIEEMHAQGKTLNWDVTTFPSLKELPGVVQMDGPFLVAIYSQSKHKNEAMQVISAITSEENELNVSRSGRLPSLKDKKFQESFGADLETLKGKNIKAVFMSKPADNPQASKYEDLAEPFLTDAVNKVLAGQVDVNTALREAEDQANKKIAEEVK